MDMHIYHHDHVHYAGQCLLDRVFTEQDFQFQYNTGKPRKWRPFKRRPRKITWLIRQDFLKVPWPQAIIKLWPPIRSLGPLKNSAN